MHHDQFRKRENKIPQMMFFLGYLHRIGELRVRSYIERENTFTASIYIYMLCAWHRQYPCIQKGVREADKVRIKVDPHRRHYNSSVIHRVREHTIIHCVTEVLAV